MWLRECPPAALGPPAGGERSGARGWSAAAHLQHMWMGHVDAQFGSRRPSAVTITAQLWKRLWVARETSGGLLPNPASSNLLPWESSVVKVGLGFHHARAYRVLSLTLGHPQPARC